jgi:hypothetical protein
MIKHEAAGVHILKEIKGVGRALSQCSGRREQSRVPPSRLFRKFKFQVTILESFSGSRQGRSGVFDFVCRDVFHLPKACCASKLNSPCNW